MAAVIGTYNYTYGAGAQQNRQIQFSRTGAGANTIQAQVFVLNQGGGVGVPTSTVPGNQISVEMESTTTKANAFAIGRALNPDVLLTNLTTVQQDAIIQSFPNRKVEVVRGHGVPGGNEVVQRLNIYDPR